MRIITVGFGGAGKVGPRCRTSQKLKRVYFQKDNEPEQKARQSRLSKYLTIKTKLWIWLNNKNETMINKAMANRTKTYCGGKTRLNKANCGMKGRWGFCNELDIYLQYINYILWGGDWWWCAAVNRNRWLEWLGKKHGTWKHDKRPENKINQNINRDNYTHSGASCNLSYKRLYKDPHGLK